ncbi:hypothetical protein [Streptomyces aquilus]
MVPGSRGGVAVAQLVGEALTMLWATTQRDADQGRTTASLMAWAATTL